MRVLICVLCLCLQPDLCVPLFCVAANCVVMNVYEAVIAAFLTVTSRPKPRYLLLLAVLGLVVRRLAPRMIATAEAQRKPLVLYSSFSR